MANERTIEYLETSFLKDVLSIESVTDIAFNGTDIFVDDVDRGRYRLETAPCYTDIFAFVKQLANLSGKNFYYSEPILDLSTGFYRLNAVFHNIARNKDKPTITFSIRKFSAIIRFNAKGDGVLDSILEKIVNSNTSIVIFGNSGAGKTELQKYLISLMRPMTRVIVIDNINELGMIEFPKDIDITNWLSGCVSIENLIANALRSNAERIILAEARGKEMLQVLNSALTGHPSIVTVHGIDNQMVYHRMARMCIEANPNLLMSETLVELRQTFTYSIKVVKDVGNNGGFVRRIESIAHVMRDGEVETIYSFNEPIAKETLNA